MRKTIKAAGIFAIIPVILLTAFFTALSSGAGSGGAYATDAILDSAGPDGGIPGITGSEVVSINSNVSGGNTANTYDKIKQSIILYVGSPVAYVNGVETRIDSENEEVTPIIDNVEMVPVRFIAESLGGSVQWDQKSLTANIILGGKSFGFTQGSAQMKTDGMKHQLGAPVQAYKGRTFVPLDAFIKAIGRKAFYDRGLIVISDFDNIFDRVKDKEQISEWITKLSFLPAVGSRDKLISLLKEGKENREYFTGAVKMKNSIAVEDAIIRGVADEGNSFATQGEAPTAAAGQSAKTLKAGEENAAASPDYSLTNVQVKGVDEGDVVKTDGNFIYQINRQRVVIIKADPPQNMKILSITDYSDKNLIPQEIYLHGQKLIVIGTSQAYFPIYKENGGVRVEIYPPPKYMQRSVKTLIYDMADRENIKLIREVELEGRYVSSRKIGSSLYLIVNHNGDYYRILNGETNATPSYRDTVNGDEYINIGYDAIRYFPGMIEPNYMIAAGINVDGDEAANICAYLGAGQDIYASAENLYVAVTGYFKASENAGYKENTQLYKFHMKDAKLTYLCKGEVPGTILNQFSMDEHGAAFRIATTRGNMWATDERISKNCLYVLDSMLSITGSIEDMAPGEKIYSVRFMGDRAYVVTFKTVDPLFVIDLKDPARPVVLGALKIPGYSDYLHPYDENHIIGFGKDTVEMKGQAYYLGMKIALFDVTDVSRPVQRFSEIIGDRGTDSELLTNHRALLFSREKNLLAFPVTLMEVNNNPDKMKMNLLQYGEFTFQGALVYNLDIEKGFNLKGRITHLTGEDYLKAGNSWYNSNKNVQRIIYIGDTLFTLSNSMVKANAMSDLKERGSVAIP